MLKILLVFLTFGTILINSDQKANADPLNNKTLGQMIDSLTVSKRDMPKGYTRSKFGPAWQDGNNSCNTRDRILKFDLQNLVMAPNNCFVLSGTLFDVYTGKTIDFNRGWDSSGNIQIDHIVSLFWAWVTGAQNWSYAKRVQFANDPINLQAVEKGVNEDKSYKDATKWLPPYKPYTCVYIKRQVEVILKYGLWVTEGQKDLYESYAPLCKNII